MRAENTCSGREIEACARVSRGENGAAGGAVCLGAWSTGSLTRRGRHCPRRWRGSAPYVPGDEAVGGQAVACGLGGEARGRRCVIAPSNLSPWTGCRVDTYRFLQGFNGGG